VGVYKNVIWKLAVALTALFDLEIKQMDIVGAFLNLTTDTDIYIKVPLDWEINEEILKDVFKWACKLLKALYSLKQAPQLWQKELAFTL